MKKLLRKRSMLLVALLVGLCMPMMAQTSYTFNVASLNVEGVPQVIDLKTANQGALGESGTTVVAQKIAMENWGIIGLYEDYNYHEQLYEVLNSSYHCINNNRGGNRNAVTGDIATLTSRGSRNATDGLAIFLNKVLGESNNNLTSAQMLSWSTSNLSNIQYTADADYYVADDGADRGDTWAHRGYRRYEVTLPNVGKVDVYILHMDAGDDLASGYTTALSRSVNSAARENQLANLAAAIISNANLNRPAIVMGVTNSLYTREDIKTKFIDAINVNGKLTVNDAWVELKRGGKYPTFGTDAEIPGNFYYDDQNGEVVNKIFYINNSGSAYTIKANSYFRDVDNFGLLKNPPVVVNFTITDGQVQSLGTTVTIKDADNTDVTVSSSWLGETTLQTVTTPTYAGEAVPTSGSVTGRYLMNVGSGLYLNTAARWGTQAAEDSEAMPITITFNAGSTYTLQAAYGGGDRYVFRPGDGTVYMDGAANSDNTWTIDKIGATNQYKIYATINKLQYALTSTADPGNPIVLREFDANNDRQKWIILSNETQATVFNGNLANASATNPFDVTPFVLPGADFNHNNVDNGPWKTVWNNNDKLTFSTSVINSGIAEETSAIIYSYEEYNSTDGETPFQELAITNTSKFTMPAGKYILSFEGVYRARAYSSWNQFAGNADFDKNITMSLQNSDASITSSASFVKNSSIGLHAGAADGFRDIFRDNDTYKNSCALQLSSPSALTFKFHKPAFVESSAVDGLNQFGAEKRRFFMAMDNVQIKYLGNEAADVDYVKILVSNYLYQTALKVAALNKAGQAAYNVSEVISRYRSDALSEDGSVEIAMIDAAYEAALAAHNAQEIEDATNDGSGDVTSMIVNPSFEQGITGWTAGSGNDVGVKVNGAEGSVYYVDNAHSDVAGESEADYQLYNAYVSDADMTSTGAVTQTITGLTNGLYELKALVTSFKGNKVYLIGNEYHEGVEVKNGKSHFEEATLLFMVENGTAKIGAVGGSYDGHYYPSGSFFKADNFRLRYVCDPAHGRVYLAHKDASAVLETLDATAKAYAAVTNTNDDRLGELLERYKNADNTIIEALAKSDGTAEAGAIYTALTQTALQQKAVGSDMTWCISDPSFELGKYVDGGWSRLSGSDVKAAMQDDPIYKAVGVEGSYLFNAWDAGVVSPLSYTIEDIPNGTYRLTAMLGSDAGKKIFLVANETSTSVVPKAYTDKNQMQTYEGSLDIAPTAKENTITDVNGYFTYKTDNGSLESSKYIDLDNKESISISVSPNNEDESLTITGVVITYRDNTGLFIVTSHYGGSLSATADGEPATVGGRNSTDRTYTISDLNAQQVTITNGSSSHDLQIEHIKVSFKRVFPKEIFESKFMLHEVSLDFEVTDGTAEISVVGENAGEYNPEGGYWFKADDFHLQLLFPNGGEEATDNTLYLSENATYMPDVDFSRDAQSRSQYGNIYGYSKVTVERTLTHGSWGTLVLPFDLPIANLGDGNWDVRELSESENETDDVVVTFTTPANGIIKAGKCYIVRHDSQDLSTIEIDVNDQTTFITTADYFDTSCGAEGNNQMVEFIGTYTRGYVPVGSFFINSKNQFKEVVKANTNKIKGFRGYFTVKSEAKGRALSFRLGEGTGVDSVNNGEVTVVAIYNLQGMRLNDMEPGINILQMSDGSSVKVLIK